MSDLSISARRLPPSAKAGLSIFARYATIIGLAAMIVVFSILSRAEIHRLIRDLAEPTKLKWRCDMIDDL